MNRASTLRQPLRTLATSCVVGLVLMLTTSSAAQAGTYTVYGCKTPSGAAAPVNGWHDSSDAADDPAQHDFWGGTCPGPYYLKMDPFFSHVDGAYVEATFVAAANTAIQSFTISRAVRLVPGAGYLYQAWELSGGQWRLIDGCTTASACATYGDLGNPAASSSLLRQTAPSGTTEIRLEVLCARSGGCPGVSSQGNVSDAVWLFSSAITLSDDYSPQLAGPPSGPLVSGGTLAGVEPVSIGATDAGSGVYQAMIDVDGRILQRQVLNANGGQCQAPFVALLPCQPSASGTMYFNTAQLADGGHTLLLLVTDAAGNVAAWGPISVDTENNPCRPSPVAGGLRLGAAFAVKTRIRVRVHGRARVMNRTHLVGRLRTSYRQRPLIVGSLTTSGGAPVPGARICVAAKDQVAGAPLQPVSTVTTNAAGRFVYRPPSGASRSLSFIDRVPDGAISAAVGLTVRVPVAVHLHGRRLRNGQAMEWSGRLPGPVPRGLLGLMQVWRGTYWESFQQVPISRSGRWRASYRFRFTTGAQSYEFRFLVPGQSGYPYARNASAPFHVAVIG